MLAGLTGTVPAAAETVSAGATGLLATALSATTPNPAVAGELRSHRHASACSAPLPEHAACHVVVDVDVSVPLITSASSPPGYSPADLRAAYGLPPAPAGAGRTVAIVDAYDLPTAQADLDTYRAQFGLPRCGAGCFTTVNQDGGTVLPPAEPGWGQEIALDLDMVSAACPSCSILLVEASSTSMTDLGAAVNTAVRLGAVAVSNSYGGPESTSSSTYDTDFFHHPGVAITASSGDSGYGVSYPAASPYVTAVGGTSLTRDSSTRGFTERAWNGSGSGCSAYITKPSWQHDTACSRRTVADVAAVADPATGVAVYDSTPSNNQSGWMVAGGTSIGAPLVAATYALATSPPPRSSTPASFAYSHPSSLHDVTGGSNASCGTYLCTAGSGYDGPTGLGTPFGTGAFAASQPAGGFVATGPTRVLDTRTGTGAPTAPLGRASSLTLTVPNLPPGTTGVVLNLTATNLTGAPDTYISACPAAQPLTTCTQTSMLNPHQGTTTANELTVPVGPDGAIHLYNNTGTIDLVADLAGYLTTP